MRVLQLTPEVPRWPGGTGGATRQFHLLAHLSELGHEVVVVAPVPADDDGAASRGLAAVGVRLVPSPRPSSRLFEAGAAVARHPSLGPQLVRDPVLAWQVSVFWHRMRPLVRDEMRQRPPDVVLVEHDNAAGWMELVPEGTPAILVMQNSGPDYYWSRSASAGRVAGVLLDGERRRFARFHRRWLHRYVGLIAMSDVDAARVRTADGPPVVVVPNGVATDQLLPAAPSKESANVLFTGTLNHPPNSEGIVWFAEAIWPVVRRARPDARLLIVGREPPSEVSALSRLPGVEVVGPVPDISPYFQRSTAVVVPLRSGGGTRLKILEAMASGRAVVSTSAGCEGLSVIDGAQLLIRDNPDAFAAATVELLDDHELREGLAGRGRKLVTERYDWRVIGDELETHLQRLVS